MPFTALCKPDALLGPCAAVRPERARAFLRALAAICAADDVDVPEPYRAATHDAMRQVIERRRTEPSFVGEPVDARLLADRLMAAAGAVVDDLRVPVPGLLRTAVEGLGFEVIAAHSHVMSPDDVDGIYRLTTTTTAYEDVRSALLEYLAGNEVLIWWLRSAQPGALLEWWKTFARHILVDRKPNEYRLVNLVHVCGPVDAAYLDYLRPSPPIPNS